MNYDVAPQVYVGLFWMDGAETVAHKVALLSKDEVVEAVCHRLGRLPNQGADQDAFLLEDVRGWDGDEVVTLPMKTGKLIVFSTPLEGGRRQPR